MIKNDIEKVFEREEEWERESSEFKAKDKGAFNKH